MVAKEEFNISQILGKKYLYILATIIIVLLVVGGVIYYKTEAKRIRKEKYEYLRTITNYKIAQILKWKDERMADAMHFSSSPLYVKAIEKWFINRDSFLRNEIINRNRMIRDLRGYRSVYIATKDSAGFFSSELVPIKTDPELDHYIDSCIMFKKVIFSDFYKNTSAKTIQLAIVSPMINENNQVSSVLVFIVDPSEYFFPLIQATLMPSNTSEIMLVERKGDSVIYINDLKYKPGTALKFREPITKSYLPAVQAAFGKEGLCESTDYRNVPILADIKHIEGTDWYMITKVDDSEIFSELKFRAVIIIIIETILILLSIVSIIVLAIIQKRKSVQVTINDIQHTLDQLNRAELISKTGNWEIHLKDNTVYGSLGARRIYGLKGEKWDVSDVHQIALPQFKELLDNALYSLIRNNTPYDVEYKIKQVGTGKIIDLHSVGAFDHENKIIFGTIQDVTEYKKQEELLKEKDLVFQSLLEYSPVYVFFKDHNIRAVHLSKNFEKMLGMPLSEIIGKNMFELFPSELAKSMVEDDKKVLFNEKLVEVDEELNGRFYTTIKFSIKREGLPPMLAGFTLDVTDKKKAENELIIALQRAERSDKLKEAFLQNMSHEIRTPLNAIVGFSELLTDPTLTEDKKANFISIIMNSSNQLLSIVNDVLTIARIQTDQEIINKSPVNINNTLMSLQAIFYPRAAEKGLNFVVERDLPDSKAEIITDGTKLNQILSNLLSNALKFTQNGEVHVSYKLKDGMIEFCIKDSGIGIKKEHFNSIFERFSQADLSIGKKFGGTGLGLSICKAYSKMLGGDIWVESEYGSGSSFYFTIPYELNLETKPKQGIETKIQPKDRIILVVDDENFNYELIKEILEGQKLTIIHAGSGVQAIDICKHNPHISLVLMDIKMPEMDGNTATKIIKELRPELPIIAQTAYALSSERDEFMKAGFDGYITKPIDKYELIATINKF